MHKNRRYSYNLDIVGQVKSRSEPCPQSDCVRYVSISSFDRETVYLERRFYAVV